MSGSYGLLNARVPDDSSELLAASSALQWFAVQTRYRFEKSVAAQLNRKNCETYLPLLTEHHTWTDRQKEVTIPLFPGYAFVHIDQASHSRQAVLRTAGLIGFVNFGGVVASVPPKQIEDLQLLLQKKGAFSLHAFVRAGQRVRIRGGCLNGLEGLLVQQGKDRLLISVEAIQRSLAIEIQGYELELA